MTAANEINYDWSDGFAGPRRTVGRSIDLSIIVSNACQETVVAVRTTAVSCCEVYLPTAFSPNGDGVNDVYRPALGRSGCRSFDAYTLRVYDRWGGLVFLSDGLTLGWDGEVNGRPATGGVFTVVVGYFDGVGTVERAGVVNVLR
ncbi:T9SS type B sorting domain-containing protein [Neolewinella antarctica]|uniref:Gliding motility-associated-like protein n=1 Tax=Neolewinella antarctica TaxID=442734 RepID=A0ABX0X8T1_9BACT|nr:gliding motility-associated C-terminal domain-containing protein [Neolewinella antarctica]NJC25665.1 gliding motility-associated-like protein [Neolewinella antarctica]